MSYEVRDVLETVHGAPPPPRRTSTDDIIATARRMRVRRRAGAAVSGTAAVVAAMVAAVAVLGGPSASGPVESQVGAAPSQSGAVSSDSPPEPLPEFRPVASVDAVLPNVPASDPLLTLPSGLRTVFGEYRTGEYRIGPVRQVSTDRHELPVYRDGETTQDEDGSVHPLIAGSVTFYRAGVYDPARLGAEQPTATWGDAFGVTVAGRAGIGREMTYRTPGPRPSAEGKRTAVAWKYAPDSWATYMPEPRAGGQSREDAVRIAAAVTAKPVRDVRLPYRLGTVPAGWQVVAVAEATKADSDVVSEVYLHRGPLPADARAVKVDVLLPVLRIAVVSGEPKAKNLVGKDGVHCYPEQPSCTIIRGGYVIDVEGRFAEGLSVADVHGFANGLRLVDPADPNTWVPVGG